MAQPAITLVDAFRLPAQTLLAQRIPKKLLVEQGARTATAKRMINDTVDALWWSAALKPSTVRRSPPQQARWQRLATPFTGQLAVLQSFQCLGRRVAIPCTSQLNRRWL